MTSRAEARHGYDDTVVVPRELQTAFVRACEDLRARAPGLPPLVRDRLALLIARAGSVAGMATVRERALAKARRDLRRIIEQTGVKDVTVRTASDRALAAIALMADGDKLRAGERELVHYEFWVQALRFLVSPAARAQSERKLAAMRLRQRERLLPTITWPPSPNTLPRPTETADLGPSTPAVRMVYTSPERPPSRLGETPVVVYTAPPPLSEGMVWLYHRCSNGHHYNAAARHDPRGDLAYEVPRYAWCSCGAITFVTLPGRRGVWPPRLRVPCPGCGRAWYPTGLRKAVTPQADEWTIEPPISILEQRCVTCRPLPATTSNTMTVSFTSTPDGPWSPAAPLRERVFRQTYLDEPFPADGEE